MSTGESRWWVMMLVVKVNIETVWNVRMLFMVDIVGWMAQPLSPLLALVMEPGKPKWPLSPLSLQLSVSS